MFNGKDEVASNLGIALWDVVVLAHVLEGFVVLKLGEFSSDGISPRVVSILLVKMQGLFN